MIWGNFEENIQEKNSFFDQIRRADLLAVPIDRLGAFFIDSLIAYSIASLVSSPIQKLLTEAQIIGDTSKILLYGICVFALNLLVFLVYQSLSMFFTKQSVGQKIFGIQVVNIWTGRTLGFFAILKRNFFLLLELPLILPLTAIFVDPHRRIFHEKVSDSISVTRTERYAGAPGAQEKSFVKGILFPAYLWIFAIVISILSAGAQYLTEEESWMAELSSSIPYCEKVLNAMEKWPKNSAEGRSRLLIALSLYSSDQIGKECLLSEADAAFLKNRNLDQAYLAKAFALEGIVELSDEYLKKLCEDNQQSESCLFSKLINYWAESDWDKADKVVTALVPGGKSFIKNYAIEHYMGRKEYQKAYQLIEGQSNNPMLHNFLAKYRTKALWYLGKEMEAETAFLASRTSLDQKIARKQQAWLCWKSVKNSCSAGESSLCSSLINTTPVSIEENFSAEELLARVNLMDCNDTEKPAERVRGFAPKSDEHGKLFLQAYLENTSESYLELLRSSYQIDLSAAMNYEIVDRLSSLANTTRDLKYLEDYVLASNHFADEWESSVLSVIDAYYRLGAHSEAQGLAKKSLSLFDENKNFQRDLMLNAYKRSDRSWLKKLKSGFQAPQRAPASQEKFPLRRSSNNQYIELLKELAK